MILFHITPRKNLKSIEALGIVPAYNQGLTCSMSNRKLVVWLTDSPEYILTTQAGSDWIRENDPIILKVNCQALNIKPYISITGKKVKHEYYYEGIIKQHFGVKE